MLLEIVINYFCSSLYSFLFNPLLGLDRTKSSTQLNMYHHKLAYDYNKMHMFQPKNMQAGECENAKKTKKKPS